MKVNNQKISFPIVGKLSFFKIVETLEEIVKEKEGYNVEYAKTLLEELCNHPHLIEGTADLSLIDKNRDFVNRMMRFLFPPALTLNEIKGATPPFDMDFFFTSKRLENILNNAGEDFKLEISDMDPDLMYRMGCATVLQGYYNYPVNLSIPIVIGIPEKAGDMRYYRSAFNADLMEIKPTDKSIDITEEDYLELVDNFDNIDLWKEKFPPNSWEVKGLGLINLMDITIDQSINMMTSNLLEGAKDSFEKVVENIRSLLRVNDLMVSFIRTEHDTIFSVKKYHDSNILLKDIEEISCKDGLCQGAKHSMFEKGEPFILTDTDSYINYDTLLAKKLKDLGIESYLITPLKHNDELYGFLELGSKRKRELNSVVMERLNLALPILSMAAGRFTEEGRNRIEAIIQEECTSIHPSVKWKFERAARAYMEAQEEGERAEFSDITFPKVYPLYGQMDIKGSSVLRNKAVMEDFTIQLKAVKNIFRKALEYEELPVYEEMLFRVDNYLKEFKGELIEGSEQRALLFLKSDVYPIFDYIKQSNAKLAKEIDSYLAQLDGKTHMIYNKRKDFDESVNRVNTLLTELIDEKQKAAQAMFPHYFERYKTDGVECNMYIGQSMTEKKEFNPIYLDNLQLWQLKSICEMEHALHQIRPTLPVPLEVASLMLVHNNPLSIHFRIDEKRFDVEGAYNARYEIIKKRVDKAHIKGTNERITVPNKIAIVYTNKEDAAGYIRHIKYLESKGYLVPDSLEDVELEDLQGVSGLKALRVTVDYSLAKENVNIDELIQSLEAK